MYKACALRAFSAALIILSSSGAFSQTNYSDRIAEWKKAFPKEDVVLASCKEIVDFTMNASP
jgi:hypothetical protein